MSHVIEGDEDMSHVTEGVKETCVKGVMSLKEIRRS